jgi:5-methyltetrahydrofolate--homocysteine methyltransferase
VTETVVASATREVVIGFDRPFVLIGERINPTGRKRLAEEMVAGDFSTVLADAVAQVEAGANMLDVNAGIPLADEPGMLAEAVRLVQSVTDAPLCIDSSIVEALEAGLAAYQGKALVNSVTGEEERLERVLPLVAKHGAAVVAITNDETGISEDPDVRFEVARRIVERAADHGIPREDIVVDPLLMPIGAMGTAGRQVFRILGRLRDELKVNSTCGASRTAPRCPRRSSRWPRPPGSRRPSPTRCTRRSGRPSRRATCCGGPTATAWRGSVGSGRGRRRAARGGAGAAGRAGDARHPRTRRPASRERRRRGPGGVHPVRQARFVRRRDQRARRRTGAGRRPRLRVRRARHLRPMPGRGERGRAREARPDLARRPPHRVL